MTTSNLSAPHFHDAEAARRYIERLLWPEGPICPHCGTQGRASLLRGKSTRPGLYKCYATGCRKPFTVRVGTIFESSHIPLHIWLQAIYLLASSKKGFSSNQLSRVLGVTLKSAWFLSHRIREAMRDSAAGKLGGLGTIVEADETYYGPVRLRASKTTSGRSFTKGGHNGPSRKRSIVSLVERGGRVRSFHVQSANLATIQGILWENVERETLLNTDESRLYSSAKNVVRHHARVRHSSGEYVRGNVHTNSVEGFFGIFKRGMRGVYQQCAEKHLHRYLSEFDFRYNHRAALGVGDGERTEKAIKGAQGKRLTYKNAKREPERQIY